MSKMETDVAIVGGGPSGLAAAIAAAELGAKVIVLEKGATTGGAGNMGMGPFAVESRIQRFKQIPLTKEDALKMFMDYTHWRSDALLVREYMFKSGDTIAWLEKMGVEFVDAASYFPGSSFTWHLVKPSSGFPGPGSAATMFRIMTENAKDLGVKIFVQTGANKLIKEGGKITGVIARTEAGEAFEVKAKAVIIATGGFGDNPELIKKYTGYDWGKDIFTFRIPGVVGEGIQMAWDAGAGHEPMHMELNTGIPDLSPQGPMGAPASMAIFMQPNLMVNLQGVRFMNEEIIVNGTYTGNALSRQKGKCGFTIIDQDTIEYWAKRGLEGLIGMMADVHTLEADMQQIIDQGNKYLFIASSIEELCAKTGIDPAGLNKTLEVYNKACDTGRDEVFNKKAKYLNAVRKPRFFAGKYMCGGYGSLGGIKINHKTEVISDDFDVIPGLYAVGTDACSIYADSYMFLLPGNTMGFCLNSGRIAGENAAAYIKKGK